jgi:hypothetical protein
MAFATVNGSLRVPVNALQHQIREDGDAALLADNQITSRVCAPVKRNTTGRYRCSNQIGADLEAGQESSDDITALRGEVGLKWPDRDLLAISRRGIAERSCVGNTCNPIGIGPSTSWASANVNVADVSPH